MTTRPDPNSSAAIPISHSSDKNAPVKAIGGVVLAVGVMTGATVTLPDTYVMVSLGSRAPLQVVGYVPTALAPVAVVERVGGVVSEDAPS
jgi:hypothetical protein